MLHAMTDENDVKKILIKTVVCNTLIGNPPPLLGYRE